MNPINQAQTPTAATACAASLASSLAEHPPRTGLLSLPGLLDPMWFNAVRHGRHVCQLASDGRAINLQDQRLMIRPSHGTESIGSDWWGPPGTSVIVWLGADGHFRFCRRDEQEAHDRWLAQAEQQREIDRRALLERQAEEDEAFNASLGIPVPWEVAIKDVLSGLSETSMGNGANKSTVQHVRLKADLADGRLVRRSGDFLCTGPAGSNGKRWSGEGFTSRAAVTCKACLKVAKRFELGHVTPARDPVIRR